MPTPTALRYRLSVADPVRRLLALSLEIRGVAAVGYIIDDIWTVRGTLDVRYVTANDYATSDPLYDGGRFKIAVGPGMTWTYSRTLGIDASVRAMIVAHAASTSPNALAAPMNA